MIFSEGWVRLGRLAGRVKHLDALAAFIRDLPPERVARRTGIEPAAIRRLASGFAHAERAACYGRVGLCTQRYGTLAAWLQQALNLVTGRLDETGGMLLPTPAVDVVGIFSRLGWRGTFDRWRSSVQRLPEFGGELPVAALADEIECTGRGSVRALITVAGNPVLSVPNGRRLERALGTLEHMVAVDPYLNETTRPRPRPPAAGAAAGAWALRPGPQCLRRAQRSEVCRARGGADSRGASRLGDPGGTGWTHARAAATAPRGHPGGQGNSARSGSWTCCCDWGRTT